MTAKINNIIKFMIRIVLLSLSMALLASLFSCKCLKTSKSTEETVDTLSVAPVSFNIDSLIKANQDTVYLTHYDTVVKDSIRIKYVWNEDTKSSTIEVDCPDCKEKTITHTIDLSEKSKKKIEERAEKRADKEIKKQRKQWFKDGRKEGKKAGRREVIIGLAVLIGIYILIKFKTNLPI